jgi:phosphatidylglycerophosphate synthase
MLDKPMRRVIDPPLNVVGRWLSGRGVDADTVTLVGLAFGLFAAFMVALGVAGWLVLVPLALSRVMDGLDGAIARATGKTDFGGYLDILCDFAFYGAIPLAFVIRDPDQNAVAGAFLLFSFYVNGASFLGYAALAERNGMESADQGEKTLYYAAGLLEGTETILFFVILLLIPGFFVPLAWAFGLLCLVTAIARAMQAHQVFQD